MTKFVALVSGKGGVGKTTSTINLGYALTSLGKKTILLDANLTTPNLALHLGFIDPEKTLNEFLRKESSLQEITYQHDSGINFIPASPAYQESQKNNSHQLSEIFEHLDDTTEFVLIDSPSGLGAEVSHVLKNSDEALIVVNPNLSSVMDALKTIKLAEEHNNIIAGIILNMSNRGKHELKPEEIEKILSHPIIGNIQQHKKMRKSLHQRMPVNHLFPKSAPAKQYQKIASYLCQNETD